MTIQRFIKHGCPSYKHCKTRNLQYACEENKNFTSSYLGKQQFYLHDFLDSAYLLWTALICPGQRLSALDSAYLPWTVLIYPGQHLSALDSAYLPWTSLICPGQRLSALDSAEIDSVLI